MCTLRTQLERFVPCATFVFPTERDRGWIAFDRVGVWWAIVHHRACATCYRLPRVVCSCLHTEIHAKVDALLQAKDDDAVLQFFGGKEEGVFRGPKNKP